MSAVVAMPPVKPWDHSTPGVSPAASTAVSFHYTQTDSFAALLQLLGASLLVSTYQANKLLVARATGGGLSMLVRTFDRPMGVAVDDGRLAIGTRDRVWFLRNASDIAAQVEPAGSHDACFLPRSCHVTGDIGVHELAWVGDELWAVNTRFSCLCTLHPDYSFVPRWRPPFITALARRGPLPSERSGHRGRRAEVRHCPGRDGHCRRLASQQAPGRLRDGSEQRRDHQPRPVDAALATLARRPTVDSGIRDRAACDWSMLLAAAARTIAELPGFARGLAFSGPYAFVGLSKIRKTSAMDGVPLAERREQLKCGVAVVDLHNGHVFGLLEFQTAVEEIFDVQLLPSLRFPEVLGFQQETIQHTFIVPPKIPDCGQR